MSNYQVKLEVVSLFQMLGMENMTDRGAVYSLAQMKDTNHFLSFRGEAYILGCVQSSAGETRPYVTLDTGCHTYIRLVKTPETFFELQISSFTNCCF